ncbi:MAG: sporulation protein YqfD [Acutalibacteraceae bacterium]|nr:sporulation protein YqfD [Oscillospiraceae bacterium]
MLLSILNFFRGYISVKACGGFSERFINLCSVRGVPVWDISCVGDDMFFFTRADSYRELKRIAKKSGMDIRVHGRFGLPFFIYRNKNRAALAVGLALVLCFIAFMSTRIWSIQVTGNENVFDSEIISGFEKLGVKIGARKSKIDVTEVQRRFLSEMEDKIIWASLNLEGMCAEIQVRELEKGKSRSDGKPCNIVADFDGTIRTMRTFAGTPVEKIKNGVKKGDLLISGIIEYYEGELDFVEARGEITAEHTVTLKEELSSVAERKYTDRKTSFAAVIFARELSLGNSWRKNENAEITKEEEIFEINGVRLPFGFNKYVSSLFVRSEAGNAETEKGYLLCRYLNSLEEKTKNSDVISVVSSFDSQGGRPVFSGEVRCVDYIGKSAPINIKEE